METLAFINIGVPQLLLILLIVLLLFGSRKLPGLAKSVGSSMRELRKGLNEGEGDAKSQKPTDEARSNSSS